jgi:antitoxin HicB
MIWVGDKVTTLPSRDRSEDRKEDLKGTRSGRSVAGSYAFAWKAKPMRTFVYFARFEPGEDHGIVVSFPDVPEAITQGDDEADAYAQAEEALGLALLTYPARSLPLPRAKTHRGAGLVPIAVEAEVAAKLAVIEAVRTSGISKSEFARRIGKDEKEARRILDPKHPTKLTTLSAALRKLGQRLVIATEPIVQDRMRQVD